MNDHDDLDLAEFDKLQAGDYDTEPEDLDEHWHPYHDNRDSDEFSESPQGYQARDAWARHYDDLNGAPENDSDR